MKKRTFIILMVIILAFIWGHSMMPTDNSSEESTGIMHIMQAVLDFLGINVTLTETFVRKLAHFSEHAVAGFVLGLYMYSQPVTASGRREKIDNNMRPFVTGFFIGFFDETIQIFSGRGPMIQDVWIDFFGIFLGVGVGYLIVVLKKHRKNKKLRLK